MDEPEFVAETLAWCNERRAEDRKEPLERLPRGKRFNSTSCPCGEAAGLSVGLVYFGLPTALNSEELPDPVQCFVRAFDDGKLPQYDEEYA